MNIEQYIKEQEERAIFYHGTEWTDEQIKQIKILKEEPKS